jgi:TP901 family phage tail tape measure protein
MPDNVFKYGADTKQVELAITKVNKLLKGQKDEIVKVARASQKLNLLNKKVQVVFTGITKSGREVVATVKNIKEAYSIAAKEIKVVNAEIESGAEAAERAAKKAEAAAKKREAAARQRLIAYRKREARKRSLLVQDNRNKRLDARSENLGSQGVRVNTRDLDREIAQTRSVDRLRELILKKEGRILDAIKAQTRAKRIQLAVDKRKAALRENAASEFLTGGRGRGSYQSLFGNISKNATQEQVQQINNALQAASKDIGKGNFTFQNLENVAKKIRTGYTGAFEGAEAAAAKSFRRIDNIMIKAGTVAEEAANKVLFGWRAAFRVFVIHSLHVILGRIIAGMQQLIVTSGELETKLAEVATIAGQNVFQFDQWRESVQDLAKEFGFTSVDVATAAYQALSNQVAQGAQVFGFMRKAAEFARVTNTALVDSVDLLSSVLNVYSQDGLTASQATATLFKTIELGRVRAVEMKDSLGSIAIIAQQLGINFQELAAGITTLTIQGVKYDQSATLLRNIFLKLVKPTEAMNKLFAEWGVQSGEAAIATFGFQGVLEKLADEAAKGGTKRLGELGGRIRAIIGLTGLTGPEAFRKYSEGLAEITEEADAAFAKSKRIVQEAVGIRFEKQLQKFRSALEVEFGQPFLETFTEFFETTGGLDKLVEQAAVLFREIKLALEPLTLTAKLFVKLGQGLAYLERYIPLVSAVLGTLALRFTAMSLNTKVLGGNFTQAGLRSIGFTALLKAQRAQMASNTLATKVYTASLRTMAVASKAARVTLGAMTFGVTLAIEALVIFGMRLAGTNERLREHRLALAQAVAASSQTNFVESIKERITAFKEEEKQLGSRNLKMFADLRKELGDLSKAAIRTRSAFKGGLGINLNDLSEKIFGAGGAADVAETFEDIFKTIEDSQKRVEDLKPDFQAVFSDNVKSTVDNIALAMAEANKSFKEFGSGETENAIDSLENALGIFKQFEGSDAAQTINDMMNSLRQGINQAPFQSIKEILSLETRGRELFNLGNLEGARRIFEQVDDKIKSTVDTIKELNGIVKDIDSELNEIADASKSSRQLVNEALGLENRGAAAARSGNLDKAKEIWARIDELIGRANDKQKDFNKTAKKLGIQLGNKSGVRKGILERRRALVQGITPNVDEDVFKQNRLNFLEQNKFRSRSLELQEKAIELEKQYQKTQEKTLLNLKASNDALLKQDQLRKQLDSRRKKAANLLEETGSALTDIRTSILEGLANNIFNNSSGAIVTVESPTGAFRDAVREIFKVSEAIEANNNNKLLDETARKTKDSLLTQKLDALISRLDISAVGRITKQGTGFLEGPVENKAFRAEFTEALNRFNDLINQRREGRNLLENTGQELPALLQEQRRIINEIRNIFIPRIQAGLPNSGQTATVQTVDVGGITLNVDASGVNNTEDVYQLVVSRLRRDLRSGAISFNA